MRRHPYRGRGKSGGNVVSLRKPPFHLEHMIQARSTEIAKAHTIGVLIVGIPNGANLKDSRNMQRLKAEGLKPGAGDQIYQFLDDCDHHASLWMEFKKPDDGVQSADQSDFEQEAISVGADYVIVASVSEAWDALRSRLPNRCLKHPEAARKLAKTYDEHHAQAAAADKNLAAHYAAAREAEKARLEKSNGGRS